MKQWGSILRKKGRVVAVCGLVVVVSLGLALWSRQKQSDDSIAPQVSLATNEDETNQRTRVEPLLQSTTLIGGLSHPWDIVFLPDGTRLFTERAGTISRLENNQKVVITDIVDVAAVGEGGLTGMALDADFAENRQLYICMNTRTDVRVVRFRLREDNQALEQRQDIVTGIPSNASGRHSGCRIRVAQNGILWVGTGDAAVASHPQNPQSLGGKVLRVTRDGQAVQGNLGSPFDGRIFSYGHRNVQGIVLFDEPRDGVYGYSVEHGSDRDDEVNLLKPGNFGWAPRVTYVESGIPMTDLERFPDAVAAIWSSGYPTIAPSGATQLRGEQWGTFHNAIALAVLKGKHVRILQLDESYKILLEKVILSDFGRIRAVTQGPDGSLYVTTGNGTDDKIIQVTASQPE